MSHHGVPRSLIDLLRSLLGEQVVIGTTGGRVLSGTLAAVVDGFVILCLNRTLTNVTGVGIPGFPGFTGIPGVTTATTGVTVSGPGTLGGAGTVSFGNGTGAGAGGVAYVLLCEIASVDTGAPTTITTTSVGPTPII
jgi:hypothetical protein